MAKRIGILFCAAAALFLVLCLGEYKSLGRVERIDVSGIAPGNEEYVCGVLPMELVRGRYLRLPGYAFHLGRETGSFNSRFLIRDEETGDFYALHTELYEPAEADALHGEKNAGMLAQVPVTALPASGTVYILYENDGERVLLDTGEICSPEGLRAIYESYQPH